MSSKGEVVSVNVSEQKGTVKHSVAEILVGDRGITGDAHAGRWHRQVSLLGQENIDSFIKETGRQIRPGEFAENITLQGIDLSRVAIMDRFRIGEVELEVAQIGKECHGDNCAIFREIGKCVMPKEGVFCRVIQGGRARAGGPAEHLPRPLKLLIITLSDRASAGEYEDRSGPRAKQILEEFLSGKRWHPQIQAALLPDDPRRLQKELTRAIGEDTDAIFTLGGTGVGPRDFTPETIAAVCDKTLPGITENIRVKFGAEHPSALLSRSIAGIAGKTQLYALPGSVRAVEEYMSEILKTLEHALFMIHGLGTH